MYKDIRFALYALKKNIQSSAELRTSFFLNVVGMMVNNTAFIFMWVFFVRSVGVIGGWTSADIVGLQGFTAICYGIVFSLMGGIRKMPEHVTSGAFDRFMLSPKNLLVRISVSYLGVSAIGDIVFGVLCLAIYGILIQIGLYQLLAMLILIPLVTIVFLAMTITIFSSCFFFIDSNVVTNGLFEIFFTPSLFHGGAFQGVMRFVFTFIVPSLLIGAIPVEAIKATSFGTVALIGVLACAWFVLSIWIFNKAVKRYESANFMTFGQ